MKLPSNDNADTPPRTIFDAIRDHVNLTAQPPPKVNDGNAWWDRRTKLDQLEAEIEDLGRAAFLNFITTGATQLADVLAWNGWKSYQPAPPVHR